MNVILYCFVFSVHLFAVYLLHLECRLQKSKFAAVASALRTRVAGAGKGLDNPNSRRNKCEVRKGQERRRQGPKGKSASLQMCL